MQHFPPCRFKFLTGPHRPGRPTGLNDVGQVQIMQMCRVVCYAWSFHMLLSPIPRHAVLRIDAKKSSMVVRGVGDGEWTGGERSGCRHR